MNGFYTELGSKALTSPATDGNTYSIKDFDDAKVLVILPVTIAPMLQAPMRSPDRRQRNLRTGECDLQGLTQTAKEHMRKTPLRTW